MERRYEGAVTDHNTQGLVHQVWDLSELVFKTRVAQTLRDGSANFPVQRELRFAARMPLETLFEGLAFSLGWRAQAVSATRMILDSDGLYIVVYGSHEASYCSCAISIWGDSVARVDGAREAILGMVGDARITDPMFSIDWHFLTSKGQLESAAIEEMADDVLYDEAYPEIEGGVAAFIDRYLSSPDAILVLQGPPGTGKTRLIRAVLGEISRRNGGEAQVMYTGDMRALESDEIFVKFITGWDRAFVIEDADHLLRPRAHGNEHLHRFLAIADGVVRAQGRKVIFSTNLPNVGDLDDALVRPGRCFARVYVRELTLAEATALIKVITGGDAELAEAATRAMAADGQKTHSLARVYRACGAG
jgi:hypothetical protein